VVKSVTIYITLLAAAAVLPVCADDFSKGNFNIGGGVSTPLNPTANYAGVSGNFVAGGGYNLDKHNAIIGEFMWNGLPPSIRLFHPINGLTGSVNLYSITANYRFQVERIRKSHFGAYVIGGGGWYYRYASVDKNFVVPPNTVCQPIYTWWGFACDSNGYVYSAQIAWKGQSAGGVNAGTGFTIKLSDTGWKFYVESRYHYAWHNRIPSTVVPVTFGLRYN
jgi:hypothetical protein